jgi:hypothetical protein
MNNWMLRKGNGATVITTDDSGAETSHVDFAAAHVAAAKQGARIVFAPIGPLPEVVAAPQPESLGDPRHQAALAAARERWFRCGCGGALTPVWCARPLGVPFVPDFRCASCGCTGPRQQLAARGGAQSAPALPHDPDGLERVLNMTDAEVETALAEK